MSKLRELYHDFRDFPALIVSVVLVLAMIAFFGYIFSLKNTEQLANENSIDANNKVQNKSNSALINEPDQTEKNSETSKEETGESEGKAVLSDGSLKVLADAGLTDFEVFSGNIMVGEIKRVAPSQVSVFKKINDDTYLGVDNYGLGGYILFGGPKAIYKLDTKDNSFVKVFDKEDMFVSDISNDEKKLVYVETFYVGDELHNYINLYDLDDYQSKSYEVPVQYKQAGNVFFSKDGTKLAYEAALGNPDDEKFAMFVIDLATGQQTQIGGSDSYNKAKFWAEGN